MTTRYAIRPGPLGDLLLVLDDDALAGLYFVDSDHSAAVNPGWKAVEQHPTLTAAMAQLARYFDGESVGFDLPLRLAGTPFQQRVWQALCRIRWGRTQTYGEIARAIGSPDAVRAVGAAVGRNPVSIIVPCHRVIGHDRSLTGYAGGLARKQRLLQIEGLVASSADRRARVLQPMG